MNYNEYVKSFPQGKEITEKEFEGFDKFKLEYVIGKLKNAKGRICVLPNVNEAFYHVVKRGAEVHNGKRIEPETVARVDGPSNGNGVNGIEPKDNFGSEAIHTDMDGSTEGHESSKKSRNQRRHLES